MLIYNYDPVTGIYLGMEVAKESPLEPGEYLIPAHATPVEPPVAMDGQARVWKGLAWEYVEDHRAETVYSTTTAQPRVVSELGAIPEGFTLLAPPAYPVWSDGGWTHDLQAVKRAACADIDAQAEALRLTVLTPGAGQMAAYQRKESQAREFLTATAPTPPEALAAFERTYSAIYGEVGITADTPEEVARVVVKNADAWYAFGDAIERVRLAAKNAINAASDTAEATTARDNAAWPAP